MRETAAFVFGLAVLMAILVHCTPAEQQTAAQTAVIVGYDRDLVECKRRAKEASSFAVFEACERTVSRQICLEHPELKDAWPRCKEVFP